MKEFSGIHSRFTGVPGFDLALTRCDGESVLPRHQHPNAFLSFVFHGAYAEGKGSRMLDCKSNHMTWHPPGDVHEVRHGADLVTSVQVSFDHQVIDDVDLCEAFSRQRSTAHVPGLRSLMNEIRWELENGDEFTQLNLRGLILGLLAGLAREFRAHSEQQPDIAPAVLKRLVDQHIVDSLPQAPDFTELARDLGLGPAQLVRLYRKASGKSPAAAARGYRLGQALELLRDSPFTLAQIALDAGYYDQSHLTRDFVRRMGCTPSAWRKRYH